MRSFASILLALLFLPALLLPADLSICLCDLLGKAKPVACCSLPCCHRNATAMPSLAAAGCGGCKLATLGHESVAPSNERNEKSELRVGSIVDVASFAIPDETPLARLVLAPRIDTFLRDELRRPPPLLARASPLLL
jgi:hypothetical protein